MKRTEIPVGKYDFDDRGNTPPYGEPLRSRSKKTSKGEDTSHADLYKRFGAGLERILSKIKK